MVAMLATVEEPTGAPWTGRFYSARELARHGVPDGAEIIHSQLLRLEMTSRQQLITSRLLRVLGDACPSGYEAIPESVWQLGETVRVARQERRGKGESGGETASPPHGCGRSPTSSFTATRPSRAN